MAQAGASVGYGRDRVRCYDSAVTPGEVRLIMGEDVEEVGLSADNAEKIGHGLIASAKAARQRKFEAEHGPTEAQLPFSNLVALADPGLIMERGDVLLTFLHGEDKVEFMRNPKRGTGGAGIVVVTESAGMMLGPSSVVLRLRDKHFGRA